MSRGNIVSMVPEGLESIPTGVYVTFAAHRGDLTYYYEGTIAAIAILGGADPAGYNGELVDRSTQDMLH